MEKNKEGIRPMVDTALISLGFGTCRAWIVICLASSTVHMAANDASWLYLAMGATTAALVAFFAYKGYAQHLRKHLFEPALVLAVVSVVGIPASFVLQSAPLAFAGFMAGGVSAGLMQVLWGERFAAHDTRSVTFCSAVAAITTATLIALLPAAAIVGYVIFPLLSLALFVAERHIVEATERRSPEGDDGRLPAQSEIDTANGSEDASPDSSDVHRDTEANRVFMRTLGKLMATVAIFSLLTRMFDTLPTYGHDPLSPLGGSTLFPLVIVGSVFLAITLVPNVKFNPTLLYRAAVPVMALGFVATVALFEKNSSTSLLLIGVGYELFDILAWVLFADLARRDARREMFVYGFGVAAMFTGMAAGILVGSVIRTSVHDDATQITTIALACVLALVVVGFLVLPESLISQLTARGKQVKRAIRKSDTPEDATPPEPGIEQSCAAVATSYGLTPRESEVLVFLAKGRTIPIIARDLQIAKGTARTHAERIYRKLDVHKQQELIDLVERQSRHADARDDDMTTDKA